MSEEIIATEGSSLNIPLHPEGQYGATCIDVVDLGMQELTWQGVTKEKHRIFLRFFCGEWFEDDEGEMQPLWLDRYFTLSLHENSALRPFLENWRGRKFSPEELKGFNVAKLLHAPAYVQVGHEVKQDGSERANIDSIMRLPKNMDAPGVPEGYIRVKDRDPEEERERIPAGGIEDEEDDLPF